MKKTIKNIRNIIIIILLIISYQDAKSQYHYPLITEMYALPDGDTLIIDRKQNDYWFGIMGGTNLGFYFSDLYIPLQYFGYQTYDKVKFPTSSGNGLFAGVQGEWKPQGTRWGASLQIYLIDSKNTTSNTDPLTDSVKTSYSTTANLKYLTISSSVRYNILFPGLHLLGGFDLEFLTSSDFTVKKKFVNTGQIDQDSKLPMNPRKLRFGGHIGIGCDIYTADFMKTVRVNIAPYITISSGANIINDYGSSRNLLQTRLGIAFKLSPDKISYDTICHDSVNTYERPNYYAFSRGEGGFEGLLLYKPAALTTLDLTVIEETKINQVIAVVDTSHYGTQYDATKRPQDVPKKTFPVERNKKKTFTFESSSSTELSTDAKEYLNSIAEFMKQNPKTLVEIVGHSDNIGTFDQQEQRANLRAKNASQYLLSKGIPYNRLFVRGDGSRSPIAPLNTPEGRAKNRRVEIMVR